MTNYAIYGEYVSALSSGIVTSELREAAYDALRGAFLEESAFMHIVGINLEKFNSGMPVEQILRNIENEYIGLNLTEFFGNFSEWSPFIQFCLEEHQTDHNIVEIIENAVKFIEDNNINTEAILNAISNRGLSTLLQVDFDSNNLDLLNKMIELNKATEIDSKGSSAMFSAFAFIRN